MFDQLNRLRPNAHWFLRAGFAATFLFHGVGKIATFSGLSEMVGGSLVAALVTFAEIAAGLGIIIGGFQNEIITRLAGLAAIPVMLGAIIMFHWPRWSFTPEEGFPMGGMEFQVVLLLIGIYFLITGNRQSQAA